MSNQKQEIVIKRKFKVTLSKLLEQTYEKEIEIELDVEGKDPILESVNIISYMIRKHDYPKDWDNEESWEHASEIWNDDIEFPAHHEITEIK